MKPIIVLTASEHTELGFRTWNHTAEAIWSHDLSLSFVLSGEVTFRLSEQFHTLTTGSMIVCNPGILFTLETLRSSVALEICIPAAQLKTAGWQPVALTTHGDDSSAEPLRALFSQLFFNYIQDQPVHEEQVNATLQWLSDNCPAAPQAPAVFRPLPAIIYRPYCAIFYTISRSRFRLKMLPHLPNCPPAICRTCSARCSAPPFPST